MSSKPGRKRWGSGGAPKDGLGSVGSNSLQARTGFDLALRKKLIEGRKEAKHDQDSIERWARFGFASRYQEDE